MDREGLAPTKFKTSDLQSLPVATLVTIQTGLIGFEPTTDPLTADCTTVVLQTNKYYSSLPLPQPMLAWHLVHCTAFLHVRPHCSHVNFVIFSAKSTIPRKRVSPPI
jgi:hypothetical protein